MDASAIGLNIWTLFIRFIRRFIELPAVFVFGLLIMFGYIALMAGLITSGLGAVAIGVAELFTHYLIEIPLGTPINPDHINLNVDQMTKLFLTWGTVYFIAAEVIGFIFRLITKKNLPKVQLWLLGTIIVGFAAIVIAATFAGIGVDKTIGLAVFFIVIAAVSLGISYGLEKYEDSLTPKKPLVIKN
jgi:hypothetical protein